MNNLSYSMVVGVYQSPEIARRAINELVKNGYSADQIHIRSKTANALGSVTTDKNTYGLYGNIKGDLDNFFHRMTDGDSHSQILGEYAKVLEAGNTIISVDADNDVAANKAAAVMSKNAAVVSDRTSTSPKESDISDTGSWAGVKIFKGTASSTYDSQKMSTNMNEATVMAKDAMATVATQSKEMMEKASDAVDDLGDKTRTAFNKAADSTKETAGKLADKTENTLNNASRKIEDWKKP